MINANELRIGNIVQNLDGTYCPVSSLVKTTNEVISVGAMCQPGGKKFSGGIEEFSPVRITRTLLERIGFKIQTKQFENWGEQIPFFVYDAFYLKEFPGGFTMLLQSPDGSLRIIGNVTDYHRFQNLYFELTSAEFPFNLTTLQ